MDNKLSFIIIVIGILLIVPMTNQVVFAQVPIVDGLFYGDPDGAGPLLSDFAAGNYSLIGAAPDGRGTYYSKIIGSTLYIAVVAGVSANDNVFGLPKGGADDDYLISAGWWNGPPHSPNAVTHTAWMLIHSDNMTFNISTDCGDWNWVHGYAFYNDDPDGNSVVNPLDEWEWFSGPDDNSEGNWGTLPPTKLIDQSTSFVWNLKNSLWDVTLGGARAVAGATDWKSPDDSFIANNDITDNGYPTWDPINYWEWSIVYEIALDLTGCDLQTILFNPVHNSPAKDGTEDIIFPDLYDWGDLPEGIDPFTSLPYAQQYPTLLASDGPRHLLNPGGPYLGSIVDSDADGVPGESADGDDIDGNDDHDGVTFVALNPTGGSGATIPIGTAQFDVVAGTDGILNAWVDWNADGDFDDTNERIANEMVLTSGSHSLIVDTIDEPDEVLYHRWRFTSSTGEANTPSGVAPNGEVEDYMDTEVPLPVELTYFKVNIASNGVLCEWLTESEIENLGFILERKTDDDWQAIASYKSDSDLMGQGTTSAPKVYEYLDGLVEVNTTYSYRLADIDYDGVVTYHAERTVKVEHTPNVSIVQELMVLPAYPNPFNPTTSIDYAIPVNGIVKITIYDLLGSRIKTLLNMEQVAGWHHVQWNGDDDNGVQMSAGMYLVSINTGQNIKTMKLLFIK